MLRNTCKRIGAGSRALLCAPMMWASVSLEANATDTSVETVVVTATRSERDIGDVPGSVSVITARAIADTPAQVLDDILRRSPSVDVPSAASYQVHPTANSISMRGLGGIRALVLLDGVPINDPFFGYMQWSRVPLERIDQVEIVRGGAATLWGNYAMGGVINVRTREPADREFVVQGGGGSYGTYRANVLASLVQSDVAHLGIDLGRYHTDGFMQIEPDIRGPINVPTAYTSNNATLRGSYDLSPTLEASARIDYFENDQNLQTQLSTNAQRTWNYSAALKRSFAEQAALDFTVFGSDSDFETNNTGGFEGVPENEAEFIQNAHDTPVNDLGASLVWSRAFDTGWLRSYSVGADFQHIAGQDIASIFDQTGALVRTDVGEGKQRFWGAFVQASVHPVEDLEILGSVRYQSFENFDAFDGTPGGLGETPSSSETSLDPRISVRYALSRSIALRGAYYTAFRAPNLDNLYRAFSVPFGIFYANPALVPETLAGGEVGVDVQTQRLRVQVTAYTNSLDDLITSRNLEFSELPDGFFFGSRNINAGKARSRGVELETDWRIASTLSTQVAYTYADSQITQNQLDPASVGQQIGGVPRNRASVSLTYQSPAGWRIIPQFRWVEQSFADNAHTLPVDAQKVIDLAGSYPIGNATELYVRIENLLDEHYIADNSGFNPPLRGTPFSAYVGARMQLK